MFVGCLFSLGYRPPGEGARGSARARVRRRGGECGVEGGGECGVGRCARGYRPPEEGRADLRVRAFVGGAAKGGELGGEWAGE